MTAAMCVSIMTLANMCGRIGFGFIYDKLKGWNSLVLVLVLNGLSMCMLMVAKSLPYFIVCICLVGFSFGGLLVVFAPIVKTVFGSKFYNRNYGLIFIGYGIGAFVGPKISASFYDSTGSYVAGYLGSAILAAAAVVLVFAAKKLTASMQEQNEKPKCLPPFYHRNLCFATDFLLVNWCAHRPAGNVPAGRCFFVQKEKSGCTAFCPVHPLFDPKKGVSWFRLCPHRPVLLPACATPEQHI